MFEELKLLDVLVMTDSSFLSRVVKFFIGKWTHVVFYVGYNTILHADGGAVKVETLQGYLQKFPDTVIAVARIKHPSVILKKDLVIHELYALLKAKYDTRNAIARGVYHMFYYLGVSRSKPSIFDVKTKFFCPEPFGYVMKKEFGLNIRPNVHYTNLEPRDYLALDSEVVEPMSFGYKCTKGVPYLQQG